MRTKTVTITRVSGTVTYPASFMLVAAMNPCPCGYASHPRKECVCSPSAVSRYQRRISGPMLERIDIFVEVPPVEFESLLGESVAESSEQVRDRVIAARHIQEEPIRVNPIQARDFQCRNVRRPRLGILQPGR